MGQSLLYKAIMKVVDGNLEVYRELEDVANLVLSNIGVVMGKEFDVKLNHKQMDDEPMLVVNLRVNGVMWRGSNESFDAIFYVTKIKIRVIGQKNVLELPRKIDEADSEQYYHGYPVAEAAHHIKNRLLTPDTFEKIGRRPKVE